MPELLVDFTYKNIFCEINGDSSYEGHPIVIHTPDFERHAHDKAEAHFIIDNFLETYDPSDYEVIGI